VTAAASASTVSIGGQTAGFPLRAARGAALVVLAGEQLAADITVTFLSPRAIRRLNATYLAHDWPTDVLSFPLKQPDGRIAGDVYLCRAVAARQARAHHVPLREELLRLVIHGTLHVLGWDHPGGPDRIGSPMWQRQEAYLAACR
jgi:probable rRNA maturation factor